MNYAHDHGGRRGSVKQPKRRQYLDQRPSKFACILFSSALLLVACGGEEDGGLVPMSSNGGETAGAGAGDMAGAPAGTPAGTPAGAPAGTPAGAPAGSPAGMMTSGQEGGTSVVPPMDDVGRCFEGCLNLLACPESGLLSCGNASLAAFAATCQTQCASNGAGINAATMAGCGAEMNVLGTLGLGCVDDTLCAEVDCMGGTCSAGQCAPFSCAPDMFDADGNDDQERATELSFTPLVATDLTLCSGDRDWYVVEIPAGSSLRADFGFQHRQADVDVKAYDAEGNQLISSGSGTDNERLTFPPSDVAQRVWIEVYVYSSGAGLGGEMMPDVASATYNLYLSTDLPAPICHTGSSCTGDDTCVRGVGICAPPPPCTSDEECGFSGLCDIPSGRCIDCYSSDDCSSGVCDTTTNDCVTCLASADCVDSSIGQICEPEQQTCVECVADTDCPDGTCTESNRCIPNSCNDAQEPDNDLESATSLSFNGGVAEAMGYSCGDDDFFTFTANGGENLLISALFVDEVGDIEMEVIDPAGTSHGRTTSNDNEVVGIPNAVAGLYSVRVYSFNFQINQYTLRVEQNAVGEVCNADDQCNGGTCDRLQTALCLPEGYCEVNRDCEPEEPLCDVTTNRCKTCTPDSFEPNDDQGAAIPSNIVNGTLNTCGGPDFFFVEVTPGRTLTATINFSNMLGDIDMRVYDSAMMIVGTSAGTDDSEEISYLSEAGGAYFVEVYGFRDVYNEYTLTVSVQ